MNERNKSLLAIIIVFLALLVIGFLESIVFAQSEPIRIEIQKFLKYRDGIVLVWKEPGGEIEVFGNAKLQEKKFLPGSLMKLLTAQAAIQNEKNPNYRCKGHIKAKGKVEYCWTHQGHGDLDLTQALAVSCNLYFARLGALLGWKPLAQVIQEYQLSLPQPNDQLRNLAIGEATDFRTSPLEIARLWRKYLKKLPQQEFQPIFQGLQRAADQGTASALKLSGTKLIAKTGTADSLHTAYPTHGWLVGAFPAEKPEYAFVIFLKNAHGYGAPVALANRMMALIKP